MQDQITEDISGEKKCRPGYGLYDRALGIMYIWGIWDTLEKLKKSNCK